MCLLHPHQSPRKRKKIQNISLSEDAVDAWLETSEDHVDAFQSKCVSLSDMLLLSGYEVSTEIDLVSIDIEVYFIFRRNMT